LIITFYTFFLADISKGFFDSLYLSWGVLALSIYSAWCARCVDFKYKNNAIPKEIWNLFYQNKK